MDIQAYIASGIIEGYVLGSVSDQERREVECMSHIYPEIKSHLSEIEKSFEQFAQAQAMQPPAQLKEQIMKQIALTEQEVNKAVQENSKTNEAKIVNMSSEPKITSSYRWISAAAVAAVVGLGIILTLNMQKGAHLKEQIALLKQQQMHDRKEQQNLMADLSEMREQEILFKDKSTQLVKLQGTPNSPQSSINVYYNASKNKAVMTLSSLPKPPEGKQYQLWALVNGNPVDLGVFEYEKLLDSNLTVNVQSTQVGAFAITLEKQGGSPSPDLTQLYVIGNI